MYFVIPALATPTKAPWTLCHSARACACTESFEPDEARLLTSTNACPFVEDVRRSAFPSNTPPAKAAAPISGGVDSVFQLSQVGAETIAGPVDVRFYFVGCLIHSSVSFTDSTALSGPG